MKTPLLILILIFSSFELSAVESNKHKKKLHSTSQETQIKMQNDILYQCNKSYKKKALVHAMKYMKKLEKTGLEPFTIYMFTEMLNKNKDLATINCAAQRRGIAVRGGKPDCEMACDFKSESSSIVLTIGYYEGKKDPYKNLLLGFMYHSY